MSAAQWEALARDAGAWIGLGDAASQDPNKDELSQFDACFDMIGPNALTDGLTGLALFAKLMALVERSALLTAEPIRYVDPNGIFSSTVAGEERFTGETDPLGPGDFANGNADDHEGPIIFDGICNLGDLETALRAYHAGSDRGELRALLVEAWGQSPAVSDLRGLAARESQPARNIRDAQAADELADLARGPRL